MAHLLHITLWQAESYCFFLFGDDLRPLSVRWYRMYKKSFFIFSWKKSKKSRSKSSQANLNSLWFQKTFFISFCLCGSFFVIGNLMEERLFPPVKSVALENKNTGTPAKALENVTFPPFPVNLKTSNGIAPTLVKIELKMDKLSAKKEILSKNQKFQKHLLLLLSGQNRGELSKNKSYFEEKIRSQFNVFLSRGSVEKVEIHTTLIN